MLWCRIQSSTKSDDLAAPTEFSRPDFVSNDLEGNSGESDQGPGYRAKGLLMGCSGDHFSAVGLRSRLRIFGCERSLVDRRSGDRKREFFDLAKEADTEVAAALGGDPGSAAP